MEWYSFCYSMGPNEARIMDQMASRLSVWPQVIQYPLLLPKLKAYGMDDKSCALIRNSLSGRTQRVKVGDAFSTCLGKRQAWGPAGECARSYAIQHFHKRSFLPRQEGQVERLCGWSSGILLPRRSGSSGCMRISWCWRGQSVVPWKWDDS